MLAFITAMAFATTLPRCSVGELRRSPGYQWSVERIEHVVDVADVIVLVKAAATDSLSFTEGGSKWYPGVRFETLQLLRGSLQEPVVLFGDTVSGDDYNTQPVPYRIVRRAGQHGDCYASEYRIGALYLLLLRRTGRELTAHWWPLAPLNEQVRGVDDPWVRWVARRVASGATGGPPGPDLGAIDRIVGQEADSGFSGVVLVAKDDSVLLRRAYGMQSTTLNAQRAFWIASMTKSFTAAAILRLQEQGRLSVRDSLHRFVPDAPPDKRAITVMQLLTHTSGLGEYSGGGITDRNAAVRAILARPLAFEPGHGYRYGDDDYELLAAIVEIVSGKAWEDYVSEYLARPAGLSSVGFACRSYRGKPRPVITPPVCDWGHKGANGMSATADDVFQWTRALHKAGVLGAAGGGALEKPLVFVRREEPFDVSYGYGVRVYTRGDTTVEVMHSGSGDDGHTSIARVLRSGITIVVLSNAGSRGGTTWSSYVARQLAARF